MASQRPQRKYIAVLAVVSGLILIVGVKLKPKKAVETPISQTEMLRLQLSTQQRNLEDLTSYFARVAEDVKGGLVWLDGLETSGIVWNDQGGVVTAGPREVIGRKITAGRFPLNPDVVSPYFPAAALRAPENVPLRAVFRSTPETLQQGSWILQVAAKPGGGHLYAPGTYGGVLTARCGDFEVQVVETNLPLGNTSLGSGVFDMYGNLLGLVLPCGEANLAVTPGSVEEILAVARSLEGQLLRRYGFRGKVLGEDARGYFKTDRGVLVTEVWRNRPAGAAGLMPGDIIQALDDGEVQTLDDLTRLVLPVAYAAFDLWIWRGKKTIRVTMPATGGEIPDVAGTNEAGIQLLTPRQGVVIEDVAPGSRAGRASLKEGDRLLRIGGRRVRNARRAREILAAQSIKPVFIVVQRGERLFGVFLK